MDLKEELTARGLVAQMSVSDLSEITQSKRHLYVGVDPTGDSLHIGHIVPLITARHFMRYGHKVTVLVGGGTAVIGDPSGKNEERPLAEEEEVKQNARRLIKQIKSLFDERDFPVVNNRDWLKKLKMTDYLREVGKHFTVNSLLQKEFIKNRLESDQGISYTEFSYPLIQSYDFYHLYQNHGVDLQIGGADQWGNVSAGVDFIRRKTGEQVYGFTVPLIINQATGKKFGKSEGGAVWLDPKKTSPYQFYQFWLNTDDRGVIDYLKYYTFLPLERIAELEKEQQKTPQDRPAQKTLATEVTSMIHGEEKTRSVAEVSAALFGDGKLSELRPRQLKDIAEEIPTVNKSKSELQEGLPLVDLLVEVGLAGSKREAREFISSGSITVDHIPVSAEKYRVGPGDVIKQTLVLLGRGKKHFGAVKIA